MKILIVGINFHPEVTGIGRYTGEMAAYLAAQGHVVHVITTPPYYPYWQVQKGYRSWGYQKEIWRNVEIQRCPLWVPRRPKGITRLVHLASFALSSVPALLSQLSWKPDLALCVAPALMNAPFVLAFGRLVGAETWLHIQDFELDAAARLNMLPGGRFLYPIANAVERFLLTRFSRVSTISEKMRQRTLEKGVEPEAAFLLPNWVDTRKIYPLSPRESMRAELGIPAHAFVALYHGNMGYKQGLDLLVGTATLVQSRSEILIVICGDGPAKKGLMVRAASLPNVRFLDIQPEEKLNELVAIADAHLLPQLAGCADLVLPSKLTTMLASGKPVVAAADPCTQITEILDAVGLLVQPESASGLAEALIYLAENPVERCRLGALGRAYACQRLDKEKILVNLHQYLMNEIEEPEFGPAEELPLAVTEE